MQVVNRVEDGDRIPLILFEYYDPLDMERQIWANKFT